MNAFTTIEEWLDLMFLLVLEVGALLICGILIIKFFYKRAPKKNQSKYRKFLKFVMSFGVPLQAFILVFLFISMNNEENFQYDIASLQSLIITPLILLLVFSVGVLVLGDEK